LEAAFLGAAFLAAFFAGFFAVAMCNCLKINDN
jgi:hypothetical protein